MTEREFWMVAGTTWALTGSAYGGLWIWLGVRLINRRKPWMIWAAAALAITPVMYVLSSGPMTTVGFRREVTTEPATLPDGTVVVQATSATGPAEWFAVAYAPLVWAGEHSLGEPLYSYWELFFDHESGGAP